MSGEVAVKSRNKTFKLSQENINKTTIMLAIPVIFEMFLQTMLGIADTAMVGRIGEQGIAAVGLSDSPMMTAMAIFAALSVGTTALVSRNIGADRPEEATEVAKQSLMMAVILSFLLMGAAFLLAEKVIVLMGGQPDVVPIAANYMRIVSTSLPLMIIGIIMSGVLRGIGDTKTPMMVNGLTNIINIIGNFLLIFPSRFLTFTIPFTSQEVIFRMPGAGLGVSGAAISTALARAVGGIIIIAILYSGKSLVRLSFKEKLRFKKDVIKRILNIGFPAAIEQFLMRFGQLLFGAIVARLGTEMYAAHRIALISESISFMPGFGFALAATTIVGQFLGAQRPDLAEKGGNQAVKLAVMVMSFFGIIFFIWPQHIVGIFTTNPEVISSATACLRLVAVSQPFLACVMVYAGGLRGAGDTRAVMFITFSGIWVLRLLTALILIYQFNLGLIGAWIAMVIDLTIRGVLYFLRFRSGRWKTIKV